MDAPNDFNTKLLLSKLSLAIPQHAQYRILNIDKPGEYPTWRLAYLAEGDNYGFEDYINTPLSKSEETVLGEFEYMRSLRKRAANVLFHMLNHETKTYRIPDFASKSPREVLAWLDTHFGTTGFHASTVSWEDLIETLGNFNKWSPGEFARKLLADITTLEKQGYVLPKNSFIGLITGRLKKSHPLWYNKTRAELSAKSSSSWPTPTAFITFVDNNLPAPSDSHIKQEPLALAAATGTLIGKCHLHPYFDHDADHCYSLHPELKPKRRPYRTPYNSKSPPRQYSDSKHKENNEPQPENGFDFSNKLALSTIVNQQSSDATHPDLWYVDSGASFHMTSNKALLHDFFPTSAESITGSGGNLTKLGEGNIIIDTRKSDGTTLFLKFPNVAYVPNLQHNLLSMSDLWIKHKIKFDVEGPLLDNINLGERLRKQVQQI